MIRNHLMHWRKNLKAANYKEYLEALEELPKDDRVTAAGLWTFTDKQKMLDVLMAFHFAESYQEYYA